MKKSSRLAQPFPPVAPPQPIGVFSYAEMVRHLVALDIPREKAEAVAQRFAAPEVQPVPRRKKSHDAAHKAFDFAATRFKLLCKVSGLPQPVTEHRFHTTRRWRFDFAWPVDWIDGDGGVALEVEGGIYTNGRHVRGKGYEGDMEKYSTAATMGWRVIRVAPRSLCTDATIQLVRAALSLTTAEPQP